MVRTSLPPGFRFHPTDVELVLYYLKRKIMGRKFHYEAIAEVNIYKFSPWDLPDKSFLKTKDLEWFFFCPREKKYSSGVRVKRATKNGYWKTTGKDRHISCNEKTVGTVKTLIFHLGHAPQGERTNWVIHEYRILDEQLAKAGVQDNYVLCKVFEKKGLGPKNGAQYGAPFSEADWADDDDDDNVAQNCAVPLAADGSCPTVLMQNEEQCLPLKTGLFGSGNGSLPTPEGPSSSAVVPTSMVAVDETADDDIASLLVGFFADEDMLLSNGNGLDQDDLSGNGKKQLLPSEGLDFFDGLHDLDIWTGMKEDRFDFSGVQNVDFSLNNLPRDNSTYIELADLLHPLDCSHGVTGTHPSSLCQASASYSHEDMQRLYSGPSFPSMNHYNTFSANDLSVPPYTSEGGDSLDPLQMVYQGSNVSYNLDQSFRELENAVYTPHDMELGSHLENRYTRFMECIPAHLPSAAELLSLSLSTFGGSSIHIKAEVTHGAGECTNEALSVMMGGSSSCWCNLLFRKIQLWVVEGLLLNVVEFVSDFIIVCCLNGTDSWSYHYHLIENISYSPPKSKTGNLVHYFVTYSYLIVNFSLVCHIFHLIVYLSLVCHILHFIVDFSLFLLTLCCFIGNLPPSSL